LIGVNDARPRGGNTSVERGARVIYAVVLQCCSVVHMPACLYFHAHTDHVLYRIAGGVSGHADKRRYPSITRYEMSDVSRWSCLLYTAHCTVHSFHQLIYTCLHAYQRYIERSLSYTSRETNQLNSREATPGGQRI
jgi:hypothetical protein